VTETSPRIARLLEDLQRHGTRAVNDFWHEVGATGTPLVENADNGSALVTFLWRGQAAHTATAFGLYVTLRRIDGTDLWYGSQRLPTNLRTLYYLRHHSRDVLPTTPDGTGDVHVDATNQRPFTIPGDPSDPADHSAWLSLLELPSAPKDAWSHPLAGAHRGSLLTTSLRSTALGGRRRIVAYRPAVRSTEPPALLVVFDGFLSRTVLHIPTTLDNLIAAGRIPPTMALFVNAPSGQRRDRELRPAPAIRSFVTRELLPWARRRWRITDDPRNRVVAGSSLGGLAAAYIGMVAPEEFGSVLSQSGSYWWPAPPADEPERLTRAFADRPRLPLAFYLDIGDRETANPVGEGLDMLSVNRRFRDVLVEKGYPVTYAEYPGWHDLVNWRRTFADGLIALIGT
jgi:enterochelin esterase-like enzyme